MVPERDVHIGSWGWVSSTNVNMTRVNMRGGNSLFPRRNTRPCLPCIIISLCPGGINQHTFTPSGLRSSAKQQAVLVRSITWQSNSGQEPVISDVETTVRHYQRRWNRAPSAVPKVLSLRVCSTFMSWSQSATPSPRFHTEQVGNPFYLQ